MMEIMYKDSGNCMLKFNGKKYYIHRVDGNVFINDGMDYYQYENDIIFYRQDIEKVFSNMDKWKWILAFGK